MYIFVVLDDASNFLLAKIRDLSSYLCAEDRSVLSCFVLW